MCSMNCRASDPRPGFFTEAIIANPAMRDPELAVARELAFLVTLGAPRDEAAAAVGTAEAYRGFTSVAPPDRELADGELADVPGWRLRAVHTPGHTPGHVAFVDELAQRMFSGDHILPRITPNISANAAEQASPLFDYLNSLVKVRDLPVDEVLPAHEWRFRGLAQRADDIAAHHAQQTAIFGRDTGYAAFFYPPIFLLVCLPLAVLPYLAALAAWLWLLTAWDFLGG